MDPERLARLRIRFDEVMDCVAPAGGISVDDGMAALEPYIRKQDPFLIAILSGNSRAMMPPGQKFVSPEFSIENFEKISTKEKIFSLFAAMPDEAEPAIQDFFDHLLKRALPDQGKDLETLAAHRPHDPGGRPTKWPSEEVCRKICDKISALHRSSVGIAVAQQRAADEHGLNIWMVHKIWGKRRK